MTSSQDSAMVTNHQITLLESSIVSRIQDVHDLNRMFRKACSQLILINNLMDELEERYNRALENSRRSYRYILRLRICVLEGVRSAFYDYATKKADELEDIQRTLYLQTGINWSRELEGELNNFNDPELINDPEISSEHFQVSDVPEVNDLEDEDDRYSDTSYDSNSDTDFEEDCEDNEPFFQ